MKSFKTRPISAYIMKFALSAIIAASLSVSSVAAAKAHAKDQRKLDEMHAAAFGAVVTEHSASDWKKFVSEGPLPPLVQVDPMAGHADQKKKAKANKKNNGRELTHDSTSYVMPPMPPMPPQGPWPPMPPVPPVPPKVGYYAIDNEEYGGSMEVKNKNHEECIYIDEGIGKDDWRFGITQGKESAAWNFGTNAQTIYQILLNRSSCLFNLIFLHNRTRPEYDGSL